MLCPGTPAGLLRLKPAASVKFKTENCSVSISEDGERPLCYFLARDTAEMEQWCIALAEHVSLMAHAQGKVALAAPGLKPTLATEALYEKDLLGQRFRVCESIGIYVRSAPDLAATRTGRALMPGTLVTCVERRRVEDTAAGPLGRSFLLLAPEEQKEDNAATENCGGWVMEHHPTSYEPILVREQPQPS